MEIEDLPFCTVGFKGVAPATGLMVFKLFSRDELSNSLLDEIFEGRDETMRHVWEGAYTMLSPTPLKSWPDFELSASPPVLYASAMESAVSCMETEIIAAKNAAIRVADALL